MTQEFHLSVTPIRDHDYLVRTEHVAPGVPLAEEQVTWYVDDWLTEASLLLDDPVVGLLRNHSSVSNGLNPDIVRSSSSKSSTNLVIFGQKLFNALFQETIRDSWMIAQGIAQHQHQQLRLRLGLKGTQLHRLPWEVLYAGDRPLAAGTDIIFSRYYSSFSVLKSHVVPTGSSDSHQPLKILLVLSSPTDQDNLALKQEADQLQQELQTVTAGKENSLSAIELTILEQPGREALTQALEHNHFQVLHYAGHSDLGAAGGSLYLVNRKTGLTEVMSGEDLAGLLANNGIRMAVFNSCRGVHTATPSGGQTPDGNLAESLVRRGIPAVLAMAERIPDNVALNLSRLFYRNLKQAYPLDLSLSRTRQGLISSYGSNTLYWALPILYLHPEFDGFLQSSPTDYRPSPSVSSYTDFYPSSDLLSFEIEDSIANSASPANWQSDHTNAAIKGRSSNSGSFPDFDQLEFDDPDPPEEEQVARLVQELSQSPTLLEPEEAILRASLEENLLPQPPNGKRPDRHSTPAAANSNLTQDHSARQVPSSDSNTDNLDSRVYSELEAVLAEMGTLTPAIASSNRAVQDNPNSAAAYTNLGWALYQQGYLTEAIAAYNQAIRLDPTYADAFNRLGLAFFQQGKVNQAVRAYSQAVKLDPTLTEASTNLRNALEGQTPPPSLVPPPTQPQPLIPTAQTTLDRRRVWLWAGLTAIGLSAIGAGWSYREALVKFFSPQSTLPSPTLESPPSFTSLNSDTLTKLALNQLQQGQVKEAQATIAALLDKPNSLTAVDQTLQATPTSISNQPAIVFLKGRLIWQRWVAGEKGASLEAARQLWEQSVQAEPTPEKHNALGFAYYSQGHADRAEQSWWAALRLVDGTASPLTQATPSPNTANTTSAENPIIDRLTAYAGLALAAQKLSEQKPISQQVALREEAIKRRQIVLQGNAQAFRPEVLRLQKGWMWSEIAIQDWEKLLKL